MDEEKRASSKNPYALSYGVTKARIRANTKSLYKANYYKAIWPKILNRAL